MSFTFEQNMRSTTERFLYSWNGDWINSHDPNLAQRASDCMHYIYPKAMAVPPRDNEAWSTYFKNIASLITGATMTIDDYLSVPSERRVVARSSMKATAKFGPFNNEYVWWLTFDETGEKIVKIEEFIDRKAAADLLAKARAGKYIPEADKMHEIPNSGDKK